MNNKILMSNKEYHEIDGVSSTILKSIASKTVIHAIETPFEENDSTIMGGALHAKILNPETFKSEYLVAPKVNKRTRAGKEEWASFLEMADGKSVLDEEKMQIVTGMAESILDHDIARKMLTGGESEYSYFTKCKDTGLTLKCRPDHVNKDALIDVKSTKDANPNRFSKDLANFKYHIQAAFYLDVYNQANETNIKEFYIIAVENSAPFGVAVYKLDHAAIEHGRVQYKEALFQLSSYYKASANKEFKKQEFMYGEVIREIDIPAWAYAI